jgi:hydrogenase maturation factor HypE
MKKIIIVKLLKMLLFLLIAKFILDDLYMIVPQKYAKDINDKIRQDSLFGIVKYINTNRETTIQLDNSKKYVLSALNDGISIFDIIKKGDSLYKKANSDTLYLKSKATGKTNIFLLTYPP